MDDFSRTAQKSPVKAGEAVENGGEPLVNCVNEVGTCYALGIA